MFQSLYVYSHFNLPVMLNNNVLLHYTPFTAFLPVSSPFLQIEGGSAKGTATCKERRIGNETCEACLPERLVHVGAQ